MPEQQNIEWKESWRDEYLKWIYGFANAQGERICIGKNDKSELVDKKLLKQSGSKGRGSKYIIGH